MVSWKYFVFLTSHLLMAVTCTPDSNYEFASVNILPQPNRELLVNIDTATRHFALRLQLDENVFAPGFVIDDGVKEYNEKSSVFSYKGEVASWPDSRVIASISQQRLEAVLFLNNSVSQAFFLEDGRRYRDKVSCIEDRQNRPEDSHFCSIFYQGPGDHADHRRNHDRTKRDAGDDSYTGMCGWTNPKIAERLQQWIESSTNSMLPKIEQEHRRLRRSTEHSTKVCTLYIQIDTTMWEQYLADYNNEVQARAALTRLSADLVQGMTEIYKTSNFSADDGSGPFTNFQFQISKMRIFQKQNLKCGLSTKDGVDPIEAQLCSDFLDSDAFLKINSQMDHRGYCLAYIFSHRQFSGGVMGLAWLGYPSGYVGGVCQQPTRSGAATLSYNTGIITSNNQGVRVSKRALMLTLAHEVGHNFGAPHDTTLECVPTGSNGYYIMYPYVNPGNRLNNDKFSSCSSAKIAQNLEPIIERKSSSKPNCFLPTLGPVCGNQIVDDGEQCDCGATDSECKAANDNCCGAGDSGPFACKFTRTAKCSPSNGPCCNPETCNFYPASPPKICSLQSECSDASSCSGSGAQCPPPKAKPNNTLCASKTRFCINGECSASICRNISYDECQEPFDKKKDSSRFCYLSCQPTKGDSRVCLNSIDATDDLNFRYLLHTFGGAKPIKLPPGSPCDNFRGVCDSFSRCRQVNAQGPLARLFLALTGELDANSPGKWLVKYWWVLAIISAAFIAISFCLLKYCSDLLPTSNPRIRGGMSQAEALRNFMKPSLRRRA